MALSGSVSTNTYTYDYGTISFTFSWTATQSITGNTSSVSWTLSCSKSASGYVNGELELDAYGARRYTAPIPSGDTRPRIQQGTQSTGSFTVSHASDGTGSFAVAIRARIFVGTYHDWTNTASTTFYLNTIPRGSKIGSASNFNFEDSFSVPITKYSDSFTDTLDVKIGSTTIKTISNYTNNATINLTDAELLNVYKTVSISSTTSTVTLSLTTKSGSTTVGTDSKDVTGTIAGTAYVKNTSGVWKRATPFVKVSGAWKRTISYARNTSGTWKRCT